jgi:hypothetical protein
MTILNIERCIRIRLVMQQKKLLKIKLMRANIGDSLELNEFHKTKKFLSLNEF